MEIDALLVVANNLGRWRVYIVHKMEIIYRKKEHAIKSYQVSIKTEDFDWWNLRKQRGPADDALLLFLIY
jgi:hypothetical protein